MTARKRRAILAADELRLAFESAENDMRPAIMSPKQLAELLGLSVKTVYEWIAHGRLDGSFRKRGKHILIWRDRALDILFNGPDWNNEPTND